MLQQRPVIAKEHDAVILYQGHQQLSYVQLQAGNLFHCKSGKFLHSEMIGKPLGSYIPGRSNRSNDSETPYILMLPLSASLWTQALPHRTQIIYETDIAMLILCMRLSPGKRVVEAGTGSGSLTHSMAKVVAPHGTVFTCDFHKGRCLDAREEFERHFGKDNTLVCSQWRDVCVTCTDRDVWWSGNSNEKESQEEKTKRVGDSQEGLNEQENNKFRIHHSLKIEDLEAPRSGFGVPAQSMDAVFLDVPMPWLAIENVVHVLTPGGILATFSPCIEQTQRLCSRLREGPKHEFVDIRTVETLSKYYEPSSSYAVDPLSCLPPRSRSEIGGKRSREESKLSSSSCELSPAEEGRGTNVEHSQCVNSEGKAKASPARVLKLRPCFVSKGHSAYLTFARRRLPTEVTTEGVKST